MIYTLSIIMSMLLHITAVILNISVVHKYENSLKVLHPRKTFNIFSYEAVRFWIIILSFIVSIGFCFISMQLLVAKAFLISLQYLMLDIGAAILNINYLLLFLLEKRKVL